MFPQIYFLGWSVLLHPAFLTGVMSSGTNLNSSLAAQSWAAFIVLFIYYLFIFTLSSLGSQNGHK